jgi:hypothetical protein
VWIIKQCPPPHTFITHYPFPIIASSISIEMSAAAAADSMSMTSDELNAMMMLGSEPPSPVGTATLNNIQPDSDPEDAADHIM